MKSKTKKALNRCAVAVLSASMVIPSMLPAFPVLAMESMKDPIGTVATASEADKDDDVLIKDGDILAGDFVKKDEKSYSYSFGTNAFWTWFDGLYADAFVNAESDEEHEAAMEVMRNELQAWHDALLEKEVASDSNADKEYPAFDDSFDKEESPFWKWFYDEAVTMNKAGEIVSYKNGAIMDWMANAEFEDVYDFLMTLASTRQIAALSAEGNLWPDGYGTHGNITGNGTQESPFLIKDVQDLRQLAVFVLNDDPMYNSDDTYYLIKKGTYDLNGSWIPIGFSRNAGGEVIPFRGHIAAEDGANIKGFAFRANSTLGIDSTLAETIRSQKSVGFFGELAAGATVTNLHIETEGTLECAGSDYAGILAGYAVDATIKECTVTGTVKGRGYVGGIVGYAESSATAIDDRYMVIEDCSAVDAAVYTENAIKYATDFCDGHSAVGGIVGYAANATIMDSYVKTNTGSGNHIYGNGAYVGGIVGVMKDSDVYNSYVRSGEIGEGNAYVVGGLVGGYDGGEVKVGRFSGDTIRPTTTNNYHACFIGSRVNSAGFTYGEEGDIAYLFADDKAKADTGICGSRIEDDGIFDDVAHIGYWHANDRMYTIVSGQNVNVSDDFFYQELERGILNIKKTGQNADTINHFTADKAGNPTRGYLLTINDPNVDGTPAAKISAYINGTYKPVVTADELGAFAEGDVVYLSFQDLSDGTGYFQMVDKANNPFYSYYEHDKFDVYKADETVKGVTKGAGYYITMPASDVTVSAEYKKVSQAITSNPQKIVFEVTQVRTGSREDPNIEWKVSAYNGNKDVDSTAKLITDAKGTNWDNITMARIPSAASGDKTYHSDQKFWLGSLTNGQNNDKFNLSWATRNDNLHKFISEPTVEGGLANGKTAYFLLNFVDSALNEKVAELEREQKDGDYKDSMTTKKPYWYHSVVSAQAQPADSDDPANPPIGYTDIDIKLNIVDNTNISVKGVALSKNEISYDVVRTLTGSRQNPTVSYTINGKEPGSAASGTTSDLNASFDPDFFTNDQVSWYLSSEAGKDVAVPADKSVKDDGTLNVAVAGTGDKAYYNANVTLKGITETTCDNSFIKPIAEAQDQDYTQKLMWIPNDTSKMTKYVKVTAEDSNNNTVTDTCTVNISFKTIDKTEVVPEKVTIDGMVDVKGNTVKGESNIHDYNIFYTFKGNATSNPSDVTSRILRVADTANTLITDGKGEKITATVTPDLNIEDGSPYLPYEKAVTWSLANAEANSKLNPYDVLNIDPNSGQITVRGYSDSQDTSDMGYSPWIQSLLAEGKLENATATIRVLATSVRDGSLDSSRDIKVNFTANTMGLPPEMTEDSLEFDMILTKNVATSLSGTDVTMKEEWTGTDPQSIGAVSTGSSEAPVFTVYKDGKEDYSIIDLLNPRMRSVTTSKLVQPKLNANWIKNIIDTRADGNSGSEEVVIQAKTTSGESVMDIPVTVNFRYDGTDMTASKLAKLPDGYVASPDLITSETPKDTYDINKASVKDRQITLEVVATQGNYSVNNPESRKWSYGIVGLDNTTYSSQGVQKNDATYVLSGDIKEYCDVKDGYLVPKKGLWENVISAGEVKGSVSGIVTAMKSIDGKDTSDSYKVTINFRYDKAVLESHEETFDVVYTQDSLTNSVKSHWTGDNYIQLKANISDETGKDVTPKWESSDTDIVTVDKDGRVFVNKNTWMKEIIDNAQNYSTNVHSGTKEVTVTAKHPTTGATADTCLFTVNFRYDQAITDSHEEVYDIVLTQTSRTNNPSVKWSGNDIRKLNAKVFVEPGKNNNPFWASEDAGIVKVDDAGNIEPIINADWMKQIVAEHKFYGQKKVAVNVTNKEGTIKDSCNVIINFRYEDVEMSENAKTMDVTMTASGVDTNPTYKITGTTAAIKAVLNSINPEEKTVLYSSSNKALMDVDASGKVTFTLPGTLKLGADGVLSIADPKTNKNSVKTELTKNGSSFIQEAMKRPYTEKNQQISTITAVLTAKSEDGRMADQCNVTVKFKYIDDTYHRSSGGGGGSSSGGGGGGGSTSTGRSPSGSKTQTTTNLPSYVLKGGDWTQNALGQWFYSNGRTFTNEWAAVQNPYADPLKGQSLFDWFRFGKDSVMLTGWYTDENGDTFFLNNVSDNTLGRMFTGWNWIDDNNDGIAECYYFETVSNGFRGRLYKSTVTPDGYTVNEKGQWVQDGKVITKSLR